MAFAGPRYHSLGAIVFAGGLADVRVIEAAHESMRTGRPVKLPFFVEERPEGDRSRSYPR